MSARTQQLNKALLEAAQCGNTEIVESSITNGANINFVNSKSGFWTPLHYAVHRKHPEVVKFLLREGANVDPCTKFQKTPLMFAAANGDVEITRHLLDSGADINKSQNTGLTPLHFAVSSRDFETVKLLVNRGAKIDSCSVSGDTPLILSTDKGFENIVWFLIDSGADVGKINKHKVTAFDIAVSRGHSRITEMLTKGLEDTKSLNYHIKNDNFEVVQNMVANEVNVNKPNKYKETPLVCAVRVGNSKIIEFLLDNGATFSVPSAFLESIIKGNVEVIQLLIKKGANVNQQYRTGITPLLQAIEQRILEVVKLLVEHGSDVNLPSENGTNPLEKSLQGKQYEVAKFLIENGADVTNHPTLLSRTMEDGNFEMAVLLIDKGLNLNIVDENGYTPLTKSVEMINHDLIKHLINKGAQVNQPDKNNNTPLTLAVKNLNLKEKNHNKKLQITKLLIKSGADISNQLPLLMSSIEAKNFEMMDLLVQNGINLDMADESGLTPLTKCVQMNSFKLVEYFVNKKADVNLADQNNNSPLSLAVINLGLYESYRNEKFLITEFLINNGADVSNQLPLLMSSIEAENFEMIKLLVEHGINLNVVDISGFTPLSKAVKMNFHNLVEYIVKKGAKVNQIDGNQNTPLSLSASSLDFTKTDQMKILIFLILNGADVSDQLPLLMLSIQAKSSEIMDLLVQNGLNLNATDNKTGFTPLTKSIDMGSYQMVDYLVKNGADVNQVDDNKNTPLSLAAANLEIRIFDCLIKAGADIEQSRKQLDKIAEMSEDFEIYLGSLEGEKKEKDYGGQTAKPENDGQKLLVELVKNFPNCD